MSGTQTNFLLRHIHKLAAGEGLNHLPDRDLLLRFACGREEAAFEAILQRHGALVWSVCRRALCHRHEAEDAFQATFLTLADKARSVRKPEALACWLHGVAHRIAVRMRRRASCSLPSESLPASTADPLQEITGRELCLALDEELGRLPWTCRAALVQCYLEGRTRDEAAGRLGWSVSTLKRRLRHGCRLLRDRLSRRGLAPSAVLLAAALTAKGTAAVPPAFRQAVLRKALASAAVGPISNPSCGEVGPLSRILPTRGKLMLVVLACVVGLGLGGAGQRDAPSVPPQEEASRRPTEEPRLDRQGDPLPPGAIARLGSARWRHGGQIYGLAFSPDGKLVASGGYDGRVALWEAATGRLVRDLKTTRPGCYSLAFSPDGKTLAAICAGGEAAGTWDVATGRVKELVAFGNEKCRSLAYRRDGVLLAATWMRKRPRVVEVTGEVQRRFRDLKEHEANVTHVELTPDGKTLISADMKGTVRLSDVASGKELRVLRGLGGEMTEGDVGLALSPDGKLLAVGAALRSLTLWEVASGKKVRTLATVRAWFTALAFAPDGRTLISGGNDGTLRRWDVASGKELEPPPGHSGRVLAAVLSPDGKTLISAGRDSTVRFWDVASGKETRQLTGKPTPRELARTLDPDTGKAIRQFEQTPWILCLALTPDGKLLAGGGSEGTVYLWDARTGRELRRLTGHGHPPRNSPPETETKPSGLRPLSGNEREVRAVAFTADGKTLVSGGEDGTLRLWDVRSGKERRGWRAKQGQILGVAVAPDGKTLMSMGWDGTYYGAVNTIRFWDLEGMPLGRLNQAVSDATAVVPIPEKAVPDKAVALRVFTTTFSPDGCTLASLGFDSTIRTWDLATAKQRRLWGRNPAEPKPAWRDQATWSMSAVEPLVFAPDGKTLAVSWGQSVVLYEVATGKLRHQWHGHRGWITSLSFSADGSLLASGSADFTTLVWDVSGGRRRPVRLSPSKLDRAWQHLTGDAASAHGAIWTLAAASAQSVPFLKERIQPAAGVDEQRLKRLLADLDSPRFATRRAATHELERLADQVEPALKRFLAGKPALEARRRVEAILKERATGALSDEQLRLLRAVEVLEHAGTNAARSLLKTWAGGAPTARLTVEARAALDRLARRPTPGR